MDVNTKEDEEASATGHKSTQVDQQRCCILRESKSILNKLTVEKFGILTDKLVDVFRSVETEETIEQLIDVLIEKSIIEDSFSEMYADVCEVLFLRSPSYKFASDSSISARQKEFVKILLKCIRRQFEKNTTSADSNPPEEISDSESKEELVGVCRLIGFLYCRDIIQSSLIRIIVQELLILPSESHIPCELYVKGVCEFCFTVGYWMEQKPATSNLLNQIICRLMELQTQDSYSSLLKFKIQDVLSARKSKWHRRVFKEYAKSISAIRHDLETRDTTNSGTVIKLGERHHFHNEDYEKYMNSQKSHFEFLKQQESAS